jgi:Domain of unknown function (DUF4314)
MDDLKKGDRVELVRTDDDLTKLRPGDRGTFRRYDGDGGISVDWDSGSGLRLLPEFGDQLRRVEA